MKMAMKMVTQNSHSLLRSSFLFLDFFIFGRFDTSGSMIALSALDEQHEHEQYVEELGILVVGCLLLFLSLNKIELFLIASVLELSMQDL